MEVSLTNKPTTNFLNLHSIFATWNISLSDDTTYLLDWHRACVKSQKRTLKSPSTHPLEFTDIDLSLIHFKVEQLNIPYTITVSWTMNQIILKNMLWFQTNAIRIHIIFYNSILTCALQTAQSTLNDNQQPDLKNVSWSHITSVVLQPT